MQLALVLTALVEVINASPRPKSLFPIAYIKYPRRELQPKLLEDGSCVVKLSLYGWEYKHRGKRLQNPTEINTEEIRNALNKELPENLKVVSVEFNKTYLEVSIKEVK